MKNILVVEDEAINQLSLKMMLEKNGFNVLMARTGADALTICKLNDVDTVLMDIGLPDMNGLDVAEQIKMNKNLPIIALSGYEQTEMDTTGVDAYLSKPIEGEDLLKTINYLLENEMNGEYYT